MKLTVTEIYSIVILCVCFYLEVNGKRDQYKYIDLPPEHVAFYFSQFPAVAKKCETDRYCPYKIYLNKTACWGYEEGCKQVDSYLIPSCPGDHRGWVQSKQEQISTFYSQGDFGYIRDRRNEFMVMCEPTFKEDSSLVCSKYLRFCKGRNIMIDFNGLLNRTEPIRYKMDVLQQGQIGGFCKFHKERLKGETEHMSPLQSWAPELQHFTSLPERPIENSKCDVVIKKPVFIMKIDATVNMYHHFCDFFNLYASLHVNASQFDAFTRDIHILIWETYSYHSNFEITWKAFTQNPIWDLKLFKGRKVCFKNVIFPLLPRMIFGLYYNTPIIWGCEKSGLFHAFSKHVLHRLRIPPRQTGNKIYVTLLSRDTKYRRILNEDELLAALRKNPSYIVKKVVYNHDVDFKTQLEVTYGSDVLIGVHGAGLTHLLFLPDWGAVFELYNCEDAACYSDLARLRGVKYITWENRSLLHQQDEGHHPDGGAHAKFTNYAFDVQEFVRLVEIGAEHVKNHRAHKNMRNTHDEL